MDLSAYLYKLYHKTPVLIKTNLGLTNDIYEVYMDDKKYALRVPKDDIGIHLNSDEKIIFDKIKDWGIDVEEVFYDPMSRIRMTRWIYGALDFKCCDDQNKYERAAVLIRKVHDHELSVDYHFDPYKMYLSFKNEIKKPLMVYETYEDLFKFYQKDQRLVFSHNDLVSGNFLFTKQKDYLIDFEYAGMNHPLFDIMSFISENNIDDLSLRERVYRAYFGFKPDHELHRQLSIIEAGQNLLWAAWANMLYDTRNETVYYQIFKDKKEHLLRGLE